ncbi:MAG: hypothetical protein AB1806_19770 [Acidobacteriota bacterium]
MQRPFDAWVNVVCGGAFAFAAYAQYSSGQTGPAAALAAFAIALGLWPGPERMAFAYRRGIGIPRWTTLTSVTGTDRGDPRRPADRFPDYAPQLADVFKAYVSLGGYALVIIRFKANPQAALTAAGAIVAGGAILWFAARQASASGPA